MPPSMTLNKYFYICRLLITGTKSQACIGPIPNSEGDAGLCCYAAVRQKLIAFYPFAVQLISSASDMDRWLQSHDEMDELLSSILVINRQNVSFNRGRTTIVRYRRHSAVLYILDIKLHLIYLLRV